MGGLNDQPLLTGTATPSLLRVFRENADSVRIQWRSLLSVRLERLDGPTGGWSPVFPSSRGELHIPVPSASALFRLVQQP